MSDISRTSVIRSYRRYAPLYDVLFGAVFEHGRRRLAAAANAAAPRRLLEVGVGTGLTLHHYAPDAAVFGIDLCDEMLGRARQRAERLDGRAIELKRMDAECMEFEDDSFDCVAVPYVLSVTPDPRRLVEELRRVCVRGGTIILLNHFSGSPYWTLLDKAFGAFADKVGFRSDFSYEQHVLAHDWQVESVAEVNLFGLSRLVVIKNA